MKNTSNAREELIQRGFTLIELMIVVALVAILGSIAAPNFQSLIGTMNSRSAAFDLIGDLTMARSESLKRNLSISVTPITGDWSKGWEVIAAGATLRARPALGSNLSINAPAAGVVFRANGRLQDTDASTSNISWSITSTIAGVTARCIVIMPSGSARAKPGACS